MLINLPLITNTHTVQSDHLLSILYLLHVSPTEHGPCQHFDIQCRTESWQWVWCRVQTPEREVIRKDGHLK